MLDQLLNWLHRRYGANRNQISSAISLIGLLINLLLFVIKAGAAWFSGSIAIFADAMNNLSDGAASIVNILAFYYASRPADKEHPYGHQRSEYISSLFVAILIIIVGYQFMISSIDRILNPHHVQMDILIVILLVLSIVLKFIQARLYHKGAEKLTSPALKAARQDSSNDVITTIVVLVTSLLGQWTNLSIDGYVGVLIAVYILYSGFQLIRESMNQLLGVSPTKESLQEIVKILDDFPAIVGYHDLLVHDYGPEKTFGSIHIEIDDTWSLTRSHALIHQIEQAMEERLNIDLVCHIDPIAIQSEVDTSIYKQVKAIIKSYPQGLRFHDFQVESTQEGAILHFDVVLPNDCRVDIANLKADIQARINAEMGAAYQSVITIDRNDLLGEMA